MEAADDEIGGDEFIVETTWSNLAFDEVKRAMKEPLKRRRAERAALQQRAVSVASERADEQKRSEQSSAQTTQKEGKKPEKEQSEEKEQQTKEQREEERRRRRAEAKEQKKLRAEEKLRRLREQQQLQTVQKSETSGDTQQREQASRCEWEAFYARNADKFYKDRNYFERDYTDLLQRSLPVDARVFECGCGTGSAVWPLARDHPNWTFQCFDCSESAVKLVNEGAKQRCLDARVVAHVWDAADVSNCPFKAEGADFATLMFFLSALPGLDAQCRAASNIGRCLKSGALLLLRDFGVYDMRHFKFVKRVEPIEKRTFRKGDGTYVTFFSCKMLRLIMDRAGFEVVTEGYECRELRNRKTKEKMYRVWVSCLYKKK